MHLAESKNLGLSPQLAFEKSAQFAINEQLGYTAIPRRFTLATKEIWKLQNKLASRSKKSIEPYFVIADFVQPMIFFYLEKNLGKSLRDSDNGGRTFKKAMNLKEKIDLIKK